MTQFIKQPGMITIAPDFSGISLDRVPKGYYRIAVAMNIGFHLVPIEPLQVADKIYGSLLKHIPRIEQVWDERKGVPTTVLLEGLKGSGKSLLMKTIANRFVENEDGIVLLCNSAFTGDEFFEFLQQINQKKIVLMDEFDKVYSNKEERNNILTLLDGTMSSHTLFVLTMNASSSSGGFEYFHNRPGRVFFNLSFKGVDYEAIQGYLEDQLDNKAKVAELMAFVKRFTEFNMDMLGTLVREVNACPDLSLEEIAEYLNTKPDLSIEDIFFDWSLKRNGVDVTKLTYGISDSRIKDFIRAIQDPRCSSCINVMGSRNTYWNATKNVEHFTNGTTPNPDFTEGDNIIYGGLIKKGKKSEFVPYWDDYIYAKHATMVQDPATGVITITVADADEDEDAADEDAATYVLELHPQRLRRYQAVY